MSPTCDDLDCLDQERREEETPNRCRRPNGITDSVCGPTASSLVGHAGVVLLRRVADRVGLTRGLAAALPGGAGPGWRDRGMVLVQLACAIALGATSVLGAEQLQYQWRAFFSKPVSESTLRRALEAIDGPVAARVERVRAVIRRLVWTWLALRAAGFPWISVCGRQLTG